MSLNLLSCGLWTNLKSFIELINVVTFFLLRSPVLLLTPGTHDRMKLILHCYPRACPDGGSWSHWVHDYDAVIFTAMYFISHLSNPPVHTGQCFFFHEKSPHRSLYHFNLSSPRLMTLPFLVPYLPFPAAIIQWATVTFLFWVNKVPYFPHV